MARHRVLPLLQRTAQDCLREVFPANHQGAGPLFARLLSSSAYQQSSHDQPIGGYTPVTSALWTERLQHVTSSPPNRDGPAFKSVVYAFSSDKVMKELYKNPWGSVRIGKLMEDLDSLAGSIAFQHCYKQGQATPLLVTASVDEITLAHPIQADKDITMEGRVVWTGSSSLDIQMTVTPSQASHPALTALFSFVHLDPATRKAAPVPPVLPATPQQEALFQARQAVADERKRARQKAAAQGGATQQGESAEERSFIHQLVSKHRMWRELPVLVSAAGQGAVCVEDTCLDNTFIAMPQQRNMHGRIFGGHLMCQAYELAFATAYTFSGRRPLFLKCDEITFKKPVDVGNILRFHSKVLHTVARPNNEALVCVEVEAIVARPDSEVPSVDLTNDFMFVFRVQSHPTAGQVKQVLPSSEADARKAWECHEALRAAGYLT